MAVLTAGVLLFACSFLVQLSLWRTRLPRRQTGSLLAIYSIVPVVIMAAARAAGLSVAFSTAAVVRLYLFHASMSLAYIIVYSAVEMQSPTLAIISFIAAAGARGRTGSELFARFCNDEDLRGRLGLMEQGGWIRRHGDVLSLTRRGRVFARTFEYAGEVFGLAKGDDTWPASG